MPRCFGMIWTAMFGRRDIATMGKEHFAADQAEAHRLVKPYPPMPVTDLPR